jgi:hypothetical protein
MDPVTKSLTADKARIRELEAEVAALASEAADALRLIGRLEVDVARLHAENARLRAEKQTTKHSASYGELEAKLLQ